MKNKRKVSFAGSSLSSTPSFEPRNLPILQTKCQNLSKATKPAADQMSLPAPIQTGLSVPPPTPLHPLNTNLLTHSKHKEEAHKFKTSPDQLALSQMFEQMQSAGQTWLGDRKISQSLPDLPGQNLSSQHKPRKLEPLVAREKLIIQEPMVARDRLIIHEQNAPAGLHLAVNYSATEWRDPLGKKAHAELDKKGTMTNVFYNRLN